MTPLMTEVLDVRFKIGKSKDPMHNVGSPTKLSGIYNKGQPEMFFEIRELQRILNSVFTLAIFARTCAMSEPGVTCILEKSELLDETASKLTNTSGS